MTQSPVRAEIDETLDRKLDLTTQVTFDGVLRDLFTNPFDFGVVQVLDLLAIRNASSVAGITPAG